MVRTTGSRCARTAPRLSDATDGRDRDKSGALGCPRRLEAAAQRESTIISRSAYASARARARVRVHSMHGPRTYSTEYYRYMIMQ